MSLETIFMHASGSTYEIIRRDYARRIPLKKWLERIKQLPQMIDLLSDVIRIRTPVKLSLNSINSVNNFVKDECQVHPSKTG
ncbi:hypothetical protein WL53_01980 [Burkholderia ubonensis]|nr:hypothetical protein WL53_01980 [Burkholderia ubonensis]